MSNEEIVEEVLGELPDVIAKADEVIQALRDAECVENVADLRANIDEALQQALALVKLLKAAKVQAAGEGE